MTNPFRALFRFNNYKLSHLLKPQRRGLKVITILLPFLLMVALQWSPFNLAAAQVSVANCVVTSIEPCTAAEGLTGTLLAQSPSATPLDPLPKQRIADQIARAPLDAPFEFLNLFIILFVTLGPIKVLPPFVQLTQNADGPLRQHS